MKDGDQCPECGCGTMMWSPSKDKQSPNPLRCTWCGWEAHDDDVIIRPGTPDAKQKRL